MRLPSSLSNEALKRGASRGCPAEARGGSPHSSCNNPCSIVCAFTPAACDNTSRNPTANPTARRDTSLNPLFTLPTPLVTVRVTRHVECSNQSGARTP